MAPPYFWDQPVMHELKALKDINTNNYYTTLNIFSRSIANNLKGFLRYSVARKAIIILEEDVN